MTRVLLALIALTMAAPAIAADQNSDLRQRAALSVTARHYWAFPAGSQNPTAIWLLDPETGRVLWCPKQNTSVCIPWVPIPLPKNVSYPN
jgi:hypothetical protein